MIAVSMLTSVPACAITEKTARDMFNHLIGKQDPASVVQHEIEGSIQTMLQAPQGLTDNQIFMGEFANFLCRMFMHSAQGIINVDPTPLAQKLTDCLIETVEWTACKPNRVEWTSINVFSLQPGYFADYLPQTLTPGLAAAVEKYGQPQLTRTRFGGLVMNLVQVAAYIHTIRDVLQQVDKGLAVIETVANNPASSISSFLAFASNSK